MLFNKGNTTIRRQLIIMQVAIAILAILLVSGIGILNSIYHFKEIQKDTLVWFTNFLGNNNTLGFNDAIIWNAQPGLKKDVDTILNTKKTIENVAFYSTELSQFYTFPNNSKFKFDLPIEILQLDNKAGIFVDTWGYTTYFHILKESAKDGGELLGYVCVRENKTELYQILMRYIALTLLSLIFVTLLAYYLARQLQRSISGPILNLSKAVSNFGKSSDYSKAPVRGSTELVQLGDSFNEMVEQIKERDNKLKNINENLEFEVKKQTQELSKTVDSLAKRTKELATTNKELEQFAYIASHDLQEPLRSIGSFTQLLERKLKKAQIYDDQAQEYFDFIVSGTKRMQAVIKDVLLFSGINEKSEFIPTDLNNLLQETLITVQATIEESEAEINIPFPLPTIEVDPKQLPHLFQNLLTNAIKFRNKDEAPKVTIGYKEKGNFWEFYIKDNGIGISEEYREKIFRMFKRLHSTEEYPGTGIGLAICKKIIESHDGKLWVESNVDKGSTFYFSIRKNLKHNSMIDKTTRRIDIEEQVLNG